VNRFDLVAPFAAAIMLYAVAPFIAMQVKSAVRRVIASGLQHVERRRDGEIPYYLSVESIDDYVDFAMDAVQVFPAFLLPIVGSIYTFSSGAPTGVSVTLLLAAVILAVGVNAWMTSSSPADYVSRKWRGYSLITLIGIAFNIIAMALAIFFS
jgi:hypothetical protein